MDLPARGFCAIRAVACRRDREVEFGPCGSWLPRSAGSRPGPNASLPSATAIGRPRPAAPSAIRDIEVIEVRDSRAREPERRILEELIALASVIPDGAITVTLDGARRQRLQRVLRRPAARLERCRPRQRFLRHRRRRWPRRGVARARRPEPRLRYCDLAPSTRANHAAGADLSGLYDPVRTSLPSRVTARAAGRRPWLCRLGARLRACRRRDPAPIGRYLSKVVLEYQRNVELAKLGTGEHGLAPMTLPAPIASVSWSRIAAAACLVLAVGIVSGRPGR